MKIMKLMKTEVKSDIAWDSQQEKTYPLSLVVPITELINEQSLDEYYLDGDLHRLAQRFAMFGIISTYFKTYQQECRDKGVYVPMNRRYKYWFEPLLFWRGTHQQCKEFVALTKEIYQRRLKEKQNDGTRIYTY